MTKDYKDMLDLIRADLGTEPMIPLYRVAKWLHKKPEVLLKDRTFPIKRVGRINYVPVTGLARWMSC